MKALIVADLFGGADIGIWLNQIITAKKGFYPVILVKTM